MLYTVTKIEIRTKYEFFWVICRMILDENEVRNKEWEVQWGPQQRVGGSMISHIFKACWSVIYYVGGSALSHSSSRYDPWELTYAELHAQDKALCITTLRSHSSFSPKRIGCHHALLTFFFSLLWNLLWHSVADLGNLLALKFANVPVTSVSTPKFSCLLTKSLHNL